MATPVLSPEALDRLTAHVEGRIAAGDTPGAAVAVIDRDGAESLLAAGHADLAGTPLQLDHLLEIGSISKSFAVICALQLEAEGALTLDDPVERHLPWFRVGGGHGTITLRHLMMHTSGLPTGMDGTPSSAALIAELAALETGWEPGTRFWYSNVAYDTLGAVVEARAGMPFPQVVRERVFAPLGMDASAAFIGPEVRPRMADGHEPLHPDRPAHPTIPLATAPFCESEGASGSIVSTAADMARYARLLLRGGLPGVLAEPDFARMADGLPDDEGIPYGLALAIEERDGHTLVGHGGSMVGFRAQLSCDPEAGVGAVALVNGPRGARAVVDHALALARACRTSTPLPDPPADEPPDLSQHAGRYGPVTVTAAGIETAGGRGTLAEAEGGAFSTDHPDLCRSFVCFGRTDGRVDHLIAGDAWYAREGYSGPSEFPHPPEWSAYPGLYRSHNPWNLCYRITLCRGGLAAEQASYGRIPLAPRPDGTFAWMTPAGPVPEHFAFGTVVDGAAQRLVVSGLPLHRAMAH
jgi:CubicO group peptidase (beta-lactamase class C family)